MRLLTGRSVKSSYSFTGEDRVLESLIKSRITKNGFFVDVGCNHPIFLSNTYLFYKRGWRGVCVDANQKLIDLYKRYRPADKAICALVSDGFQERDFYQLTNNVLSTTETTLLPGYIAEGQKVKVTRMKPRSLTEILDKVSAPKVFELLSIDAEEHDLNVVRSLDLKKYRPAIIILEVEDFDPKYPLTHPVYQFLISNGYCMEGFVLKNLYFRNQSR